MGLGRRSREGRDLPITARFAGRVRDRQQLGTCVRLEVEVSGFPPVTAGQFAMLQAGRSRCFLARPYSISDQVELPGTEEACCLVSFLVEPVGVGSGELAALQPGEAIYVLGPLGRGFRAAGLSQMLSPGARLVVVAGGVGIAPFPLLLREIGASASSSERSRQHTDVVVLLGLRSGADLDLSSLVSPGLEVLARQGSDATLLVTTEDGSYGSQGLVTVPLRRLLGPRDLVVACGPRAMLDAVWEVCLDVGALNAWFSLEAFMACGVGACHGCVTKSQEHGYLHVCRDGPVFAGQVVFGLGRSVAAPRAPMEADL